MNRQQAAAALRKAVMGADHAVLRVREQAHRDRLNPLATTRRVAEARKQGADRIREARQQLDRAIATERREALHRLRPNADEATVRTLYATQGMALANAGMADLADAIRAQLAAGNQTAAAEYLAAGGNRLHSHIGAEYRKMQAAAASDVEAKRAAMVAGLDAYTAGLDRLDGYLRGMHDKLGNADLGDPDADRPDISEIVSRWHTTVETEAAQVAQDAVQQHLAARADYGLTDE